MYEAHVAATTARLPDCLVYHQVICNVYELSQRCVVGALRIYSTRTIPPLPPPWRANFEKQWSVGPGLLFLPTLGLTLLGPQSRFGDKPLKFQVDCPQNGTAVLKGFM